MGAGRNVDLALDRTDLLLGTTVGALLVDGDGLADGPRVDAVPFLLETTGWCKDMDYHTWKPETVEPLPFLGMKGYGPDAVEAYPTDEAHRAWRREFNTREVR